MAGELTSLSLAMGRGVVAPITLPQYAYQAESSALFAARSAAPTNRQMASRDRVIERIKTEIPAVWPDLLRLYLNDGTETDWLINWRNPGVGNLIKIGTPNYTANAGFTVGSNASKYDTGVPLNSLPQNSWSVGIFSRTGTAIDAVDFGAQDGSGNGITINTLGAANMFGFRAMSGVQNSVETKYYSGTGWHDLTRVDANTVEISHHGQVVETRNVPSMPISSSNTLMIGGASGNTSYSRRQLGGCYVMSRALTKFERRTLSAILRDYLDKLTFGEIEIYKPGSLPQYLNCDVLVVAGSLTAICAGVEASRQGRSVIFVGDHLTITDHDLAGHPGAGLTWIDSNVITPVSGMFDEIIRWINVTAGRAHNRTQQGMSPDASGFVQAVRGMLTPGKNVGTIAGQNIPVFLTTGIKSIRKNGTRLESLETNDGRRFTASYFIGADYEGQSVEFAGLPYIIGTEPTGTGGESDNGVVSSHIKRPFASVDGTGYLIDAYRVPGDPSSGLLPDIITLNLTEGQADPSAQSMNYRLQWASTSTLYSDWYTLGAAQSPLRFEALARCYALNSSLTITPGTKTDVLKADVLASNNTLDVNNGAGGLSTDLGNSGLRYLQAANDAERKAVARDIADYIAGYFDWHKNSGDPRIPAGVASALSTYWPNVNAHLERGLNPVGFPDRPYIRDPIRMMKNDGFVLNGNDMLMADGTTPRSTWTGAACSYDADRHAPYTIMANRGNGDKIYIQGHIYTPGGLGSDRIGPVPVDCILPDKARCENFITPTAPSVTKMAWYRVRMEPVLCLLGQSAGILAAMACESGIAVQDVDKAAFRARMLATPETIKPYLPQVN